MGWAEKARAQDGRDHWYVVLFNGDEIGSAADPHLACTVVRKHCDRRVTKMIKNPKLWFAVDGDNLYEIRKLKAPRLAPVGDILPPRRRWG